mmetsp:Transcript_673/g.1272  ORF Transcript_673/g.1272 Transcript_673/m.1272 type:complete len:93 (+) Transcript_673:1859-2137(+)
MNCLISRTSMDTATYPKSTLRWEFVANQREYYKAFLQGQPCALTEEKVDLLNSIDFTWKVDRSRLRHRQSVDTAGSGTKDCTSKQGAIDSAA